MPRKSEKKEALNRNKCRDWLDVATAHHGFRASKQLHTHTQHAKFIFDAFFIGEVKLRG